MEKERQKNYHLITMESCNTLLVSTMSEKRYILTNENPEESRTHKQDAD